MKVVNIKTLTATRPAGLEPATYGLEIHLWGRKCLVSKGLYRSFWPKMTVTSS